MKTRAVKIIATVIIVGIFVWYISANWQQFAGLRFVNPLLLLPAVLFSAINLYGIGALSAAPLRPLGVRLTRHELFGLACLVRFCKYIAPGYLSAAVRAVYLKKTYKFSYAKFSSSFVASNLVLFLLSGVLALMAFVLHGNALNADNRQMIFIVIIAVVFFAGLLLVPLSAPQRWLGNFNATRKNKFSGRLEAALSGFIKIRSQPSLFVAMVWWAAVTVAASALLLMTLYGLLGYQIAVLPALFITAVTSWAVVFSITPANIGVREGLMALAAQIMGVPVPETLAVALLLRLLVFLVVASLSAYYAPKLLQVSLGNIGSFKNRA